MSTIIRCRRRLSLHDVSYMRLFPAVRGGVHCIGRQFVVSKEMATAFKYREVAEAEYKRLLADKSERHDEYTYDLIDGGVA